jgi:hypothetical protein
MLATQKHFEGPEKQPQSLYGVLDVQYKRHCFKGMRPYGTATVLHRRATTI